MTQASAQPWQPQLSAAEQAAARGDTDQLHALCADMVERWGDQPDALMGLAGVLVAAGELTQAETLMQACHQRAPQDLRPVMVLANLWLQTLRQRQSVALYAQLPPSSGQLMAMAYHPDASAELAQAWAERWGQAATHQTVVAANQPRPQPPKDCLRIGWLSSDLCQHPVGLFLWPLVEHLSQEPGVELVYYDNQPREDWLSKQLRRTGQWRVIQGSSDLEVAETIRADQLSILVDLSGHTARNRLPVLLHRPAPVQLSWLGYWATTGLPNAVDGVIVDRKVVGPREQSFLEQLLVLPHNRWCYRPVPWMPELTSPPCLSRGFITFGCMNSNMKLHPGLLTCWAELLKQTPGSRLVLKNYQLQDRSLQEAILGHFKHCGVRAERLSLLGPSTHADLLRGYAEIDIALDTFPFNGGLTSCEALWMGIPLVTRETDGHSCGMAAHQGAALLDEIGRREWVGQTAEDYLAIAGRLASNPDQLKDIRCTQRSEMQASKLCGETEFSRAFGELIRRACGQT